MRTLEYRIEHNGRRFLYWYDRGVRMWTLLEQDANENQIGTAQYAPTRKLAVEYAKMDCLSTPQ